ncbi:MAG: carboxypeptidase-like regulatory domain-containing protein [Flavobacteriaceae bacterium]
MKSIIVLSQKNVVIQGDVVFDTISVADVHIYNKTTLKGVTSNIKGKFSIRASKNDTLFVSTISYKAILMKVDSAMIMDKYIKISLVNEINKLDEIIVNSQKLSGNLLLDIKRVPNNFEKVEIIPIESKEIQPYAMSDFKNVDGRKLKDPIGIGKSKTEPDVREILIRLTKGIRNKIKRKREANKFIKTIPLRIVEEMGRPFFVKDLKIPLEEIDLFMKFCTSKELTALYQKIKKLS